MKKYDYMIIGADGVIGSALKSFLERAGKNVLVTTRHRSRQTQRCVFLDLSDKRSLEALPSGVPVVFYCAGITRLEECRCHPRESRLINVERALAAAEKTTREGASFIYLSSDQVFDGTVPYQKPDAAPAPQTEYGRQKALAEKKLGRLGNVAVVRFGKILSPQDPLLRGWTAALKVKQRVAAFNDMVFSPVPMSFALTVLTTVADREAAGLLQVSGDRELSYFEAACVGAGALGVSRSLVRPVRAAQSGRFFEHIPLHATLDTLKLRDEFGLVPPDVTETVRAVFLCPPESRC